MKIGNDTGNLPELDDHCQVCGVRDNLVAVEMANFTATMCVYDASIETRHRPTLNEVNEDIARMRRQRERRIAALEKINKTRTREFLS